MNLDKFQIHVNMQMSHCAQRFLHIESDSILPATMGLADQLTINQPLEKTPWTIGTMDDAASTHLFFYLKSWKFCFLWKRNEAVVGAICYDGNISEEDFFAKEFMSLKKSTNEILQKSIQCKPLLVYNPDFIPLILVL
jgi:hypothetical protein